MRNNTRTAKHERWVSVSARVVNNIVAGRHGGEAVCGVYILKWRGGGRSGWRGAGAGVGRRGGDFGPNWAARGGCASGGFVEALADLVDSVFWHEEIAAHRKWQRGDASVNYSGGVQGKLELR